MEKKIQMTKKERVIKKRNITNVAWNSLAGSWLNSAEI